MSKAIVVKLKGDLRERIEKQAQQAGTSLSEQIRTPLEAAFPASGPNAEQPMKVFPFAEYGVTGLQQTSGFLFEEFHPSLRGDKALQIYAEMLANSPTVQAVFTAVEMLIRQVDKSVDPGGEQPEDLKAADLVDSCLDDMTMSFPELLSEILSMLAFGWSYHEIVYKLRAGPNPMSPGAGSRYGDGLIGWRKLPIRAQTTRWRWVLDKDGGIQGMWQAPWAIPGWGAGATNLKAPVFIPIEKALLFRPRTYKNNPEGWSMLRSAYRPYYMQKRVEEIELIGYERDLSGFPTALIPGEHIAGNTATFTAWKKMMRNIRRNEQEALVIPSDRDELGNPLYDVKLLTTGGRRPIDMEAIIERHDRRMAMAMMADFLFLGQGRGGSGSGAHGSGALASTRMTLFGMAVSALLRSIEGVFNRHAIPRLLALNGFNLEVMPTLRFDDVEVRDVAETATAINQLAGAGMPIFPDVDVENTLRRDLGLPEMTDEEITERREQDQLKEDAAQQQALQPEPTAAEDKALAKREFDAFKEEIRKQAAPPPIVVQPAPLSPPIVPIIVQTPAPSHQFTVQRDADGRMTGIEVKHDDAQ